MEIVVLIVLVAIVAAGLVAWRLRRRDGAPLEPGTVGRDPGTDTSPPSLRLRLEKTRTAITDRLDALASGRSLGDEDWDDVEALLISADVGVATTEEVVASVRQARPDGVPELRDALKREMVAMLEREARDLVLEGSPAVILVVGVNGSGKTTSVAKMAMSLKAEGRSVLLGAADTFRAAAAEQLTSWAERIGADIVVGQPGADPASVAFDAYQAARARGADVVIIDTAGRLHSKSNLMAELGKVARVLERETERIGEILLVLDGTTGQNALSQARSFTEAVAVTGIVITKLDGTARGGVAVAIERELDLPVKLIGVGEGAADLVPFQPEDFVDALLGS